MKQPRDHVRVHRIQPEVDFDGIEKCDPYLKESHDQWITKIWTEATAIGLQVHTAQKSTIQK